MVIKMEDGINLPNATFFNLLEDKRNIIIFSAIEEFFMAIAKEQLRQIIAENNITNVGHVYSILRKSFKDIISAFAGHFKVSLYNLKPMPFLYDGLKIKWNASRIRLGYSINCEWELELKVLSDWWTVKSNMNK